MAKKNLATLAETLAAQSFLRAISADWHDNNLILAIVSWMRFEGTQNPKLAKQNNVFNLGTAHYGPYGSHYIVADSYKSLGAEMNALAKMLLASQNPDYRLMVNAARSKGGAGWAAGQFLTALQASGYDQGVTVPYPGKKGFREDAVWAIYATFTGGTLPIVKATTPPPPPKPRAFPTIPAALQPPSTQTDFLLPYATQKFYAERHAGATSRRVKR